MTEDQFWDSFAEALKRSPDGSHWPLRDHVIDILSPRPKQELADWERFFGTKMDACYDGVLWEAIVMLSTGFHWCGDDSFRDFRERLIGSGKSVYETVTMNPDDLIDHKYLLCGPEYYFFGCAHEAWHFHFPEIDDPEELGELNDDQIVFEEPLTRPFPKFDDLDQLLPRISEFVRENDPKYWNQMKEHANNSNES